MNAILPSFLKFMIILLRSLFIQVQWIVTLRVHFPQSFLLGIQFLKENEKGLLMLSEKKKQLRAAATTYTQKHPEVHTKAFKVIIKKN